jgi:hypothetical protein
MRTLIFSAALLTAFAAHAEPKRSAKEAVRPAAAPAAAAQFQPKLIEAKPIELTTPELEIRTKDVSDAALDKKLAKRKSKSQSGEANVLREPAPLKLDDAAPAAAAPTSATTTAKP